mgnify:FL=1
MKYKLTETKTITREIDLLPCPFCGSDNIEPCHTSGSYGFFPSTDRVTCCSCGAHSGAIEDPDGGNNQILAIEKWNTRVDNKEARKK